MEGSANFTMEIVLYMKIEECNKCEHHVDQVSDSVLCRYTKEIEHRVLSGDSVVSCPKGEIKKGFMGMLKKSG